MESIALNRTVKVKIPAINPWYDTGLYLKKECTYHFIVDPPNQTWKDGEILKPFTAEGRTLPHLVALYPFIRMPFVKWFALLGCINRNRQSYFKIGCKLEHYSPPEDGKLTCFANDALGFNDYFYKHNNSGFIELSVTRTH